MNRESKATPSWQHHRLRSPVDGVSIRYALRAEGSPNIRILFLNGRSEWIEKYNDLPADTAFGRDSLWAMMDHRGQGGSEGIRAHVKTYDHFACDVAAVVKAAFQDQPFVVVGHSMGGLVALYATLSGFILPDALVLCSPLMGLLTPMPRPIARCLTWFLAHSPWSTAPTGSSNGRRKFFDGNTLTHSAARFESMVNSPYPGSAATFGWVNATFNATGRVRKKRFLENLKIPLTVVVGESEQVVDRSIYPGWIKRWEELTALKAEFELISEGKHELLNESDPFRDQTLAVVNRALHPHRSSRSPA